MSPLRATGFVAAILAASGCAVVGYPGTIEVPGPAAEAPAVGPGPNGYDAPARVPDREPEAAERPPADFRRDRPPEALPDGVDLEAIPDAVPRTEPRARFGNMARYEVLGRTYETLESSEGYEAEGVASWYGEEFHGRRTSSGEPYDMYAMTAAHRTLPLPSYLEVVNLDNGRRVVVRVNDRGPFHDGRLIDVSYAAAHRLGMIGTGTARVRVRALQPGA